MNICKLFSRCCCGQARATHPTTPGIELGSPGDIWIPNKHTKSHPTDAYGTIEFQGGAHPTKAQVNLFIFVPTLTDYYLLNEIGICSMLG